MPFPTCDELGVKGFDVAAAMGLYGPAGLPPNVVEHLQAATAKAMRASAMAARMEQVGMVMKENGTASFVQFRQYDIDRYTAVVRKLNLQIH